MGENGLFHTFLEKVDFPRTFWEKEDPFACVFGESGLFRVITAVAKPFLASPGASFLGKFEKYALVTL